jgi:methylenetetrahydrofolate reductase (NADPH)
MDGTRLESAIKEGQFVLTVECRPPRGVEPQVFKACAEALGSVVHAIGVPESEDGVRLCSLAGCGHLLAAGAEPILHLLTRDMNRTALQSAILGAASMGIGSILCLSGRHQTLTTSGTAKGVFDIDPIQLVRIADAMRREGQLASGEKLDSRFDLVLGTDTNPFAEPMDLQVITLEAAIAAGADFVMTQPVFSLDRFAAWMESVRHQGVHQRTCIIASVMPIASAKQAAELATRQPNLGISEEIIKRAESGDGASLAVETLNAVRLIEGVRGAHLMVGDDFGLATRILSETGLVRS